MLYARDGRLQGLRRPYGLLRVRRGRMPVFQNYHQAREENMSSDVKVTHEELLQAGDAIFDACALVRNTSPQNYPAVVTEFVAWVSDFTHKVKLYLEAPTRQPERAARRATCKVHD